MLLLGVTYKPDIADQRESPAVPLAQQLIAKGANLQFHDDKVETWHAVPAAQKVYDAADAVTKADLTILVQNHKTYDIDALAGAAQRLLDTRGVAEGERVERL